ncbi:MAG: hypothetical protein WC881_11595 [Elusimicrobiota bacterium]|jgi:hypothetical protein
MNSNLESLGKLCWAALFGVLAAGLLIAFPYHEKRSEKPAMPFTALFQSFVHIAKDPLSDTLYAVHDEPERPASPAQYQEYRDAPAQYQKPSRLVVPLHTQTRGRIMIRVLARVRN